ncbi:MAG: M23 family metallopeptidase [Gemmatimonadota bacterium]|nr:M23 family metallopeptidase [Gemmatimonadota bacterium]
MHPSASRPVSRIACPAPTLPAAPPPSSGSGVALPARRRARLLLALLALLFPAPASAQAARIQLTSLQAAPAAPVPAPSPAILPAPLLTIPVEGVSPSQLRDTFHAARSEGRVHHAIDIHAPRGTPVLAAAAGTIVRLHSGRRGGFSLYQLGLDGDTRYYYAHLDRYAEGLAEGDTLQAGQVIGYVGDTGNAQSGDYHLHFSVAILADARRWWEGHNLNPYPLLRSLRGR